VGLIAAWPLDAATFRLPAWAWGAIAVVVIAISYWAEDRWPG
jgi:hypothetical protein